MHSPSNLVLIGMPGSGKSTVGVVLAKQTAHDFIDTDVAIQTAQGQPLQAIIDQDGYMALRRIEEQVLLKLSLHNYVIATGGSAVYSDPAMRHLKSDGVVVFLDADPPTLQSRVLDYGTRGLAKAPDQTFDELYEERRPLYMKYADLVIECKNISHEAVTDQIVSQLDY